MENLRKSKRIDFPIGVGLRHTHFSHLLESNETQVDFFEVITENFFSTRGRPWKVLEKIREIYPIAMHGVSLNIGSFEGLDFSYLEKVKSMAVEIDPIIISDHLCWNGMAHDNLHNLLPLPYTDETLNFLMERVDSVQNFLGREIALENLSAYFSLEDSTYSEWDFLNTLAKKSGCKLLLDLNNVYVNAVNQGFDPYTFLEGIDEEVVAQFHLAGFSDFDDYLFDTHSHPVFSKVWEMYEYQLKRMKHSVPTLIEWDENIPEFSILEDEALKARQIVSQRAHL